jgi:dolichyl-phosphate-mannose-protein mannosyltransferase
VRFSRGRAPAVRPLSCPRVPSPPPTDARPASVRILLGAIVLLATALRIWGIDYGLPHPLARPDEERIANMALRMLSDRTLGPGEFIYPSLQKYLCAAALEAHFAILRLSGRAPTMADFIEWVTVVHPRLYYRTCRLVSVLTGVATVPLVFALGRGLSGQRRVGLIAALLLAVCYLHVRDSHFATVDVTMTFFTTLSLCLALAAARTGRMAAFAAAGLAAGLAAATKYNAAVVCVAVLAAGWARVREHRDERRAAAGWLPAAAAAAIAGFLIGVPFAIRERDRMLGAMAMVSRALYAGQGPTAFLVHAVDSLPGGLGWPLYLAGLAGIARAAFRRRPEDWVWLSFAIVFYVMIGPVHWVVPRYVLPLVPLFVVAAAQLAFDLTSRSRPLRACAIVLLAAPTLWRSIQYDRVASRPDTRVLAADWIADNVPARSRIAMCEGYGMPVLHGKRPGRMPFLPKPIACWRAELASLNAPYLVTHEHPRLGWAPSGHYRGALDERWRPVATFSPFSGASVGDAHFHGGDAFYIPYTGLDAVTRGGPVVTVWEKSDPAPD